MDEVMSDLTSLLNSIDKSGRGVCVQASTLGSLEALIDFLKSSKIPVSGINIGPVHKKDVMRAATMLEKAKELACILCFDVPVDKDAERLAEEMGIRLFKGKCSSDCEGATFSDLMQRTSSTTCSTRSPRITTRSWRLRGGTRLPRRSGRVGLRSSRSLRSEILSSWAWIFSTARYAWVHLYVLSRSTPRRRRKRSSTLARSPRLKSTTSRMTYVVHVFHR